MDYTTNAKTPEIRTTIIPKRLLYINYGSVNFSKINLVSGSARQRLNPTIMLSIGRRKIDRSSDFCFRSPHI
jgi:hypothetical protein